MNIKEYILNIIFPSRCVSCNSYIPENHFSGICDSCFSSIPRFSALLCPSCKRRIPAGELSKHPHTPYVLGAATVYENKSIRELIHTLKYQHLKNAAIPIAHLMHNYIETISEIYKIDIKSFLFIPIPLSKKKERQRGYNQSELILKTVCDFLYIPESSIKTQVLIKKRETPSQTECKTYDARRENIKGSFDIKITDCVRGKNIILLDDVFTSGATIGEAVCVLRNAGAKKVIALAVAKT